MVAGASLALADAVMRSILRNLLGSPFTLGIAHADAFGAAVGVMVLGCGVMTSSSVGAVHSTNPYLTTIATFFFQHWNGGGNCCYCQDAGSNTGGDGAYWSSPWFIFYCRHYVNFL